MSLSLYEQVLGEKFNRLPTAVQRFHRLTGHTVLDGWVETRAPGSWLAQVLATCLRVPRRTASGPLRFELDANSESEVWIRHFPTGTMTSCLRRVAGRLEERLGVARLTFEMSATESGLTMRVNRVSIFGLSCPTWLRPRVDAQESGRDNQLHFQVTAELPFIGIVASYRGHLELGQKEST